MKTIIWSIAIIAFALTSCSDDDKKDDIEPVIAGIKLTATEVLDTKATITFPEVDEAHNYTVLAYDSEGNNDDMDFPIASDIVDGIVTSELKHLVESTDYKIVVTATKNVYEVGIVLLAKDSVYIQTTAIPIP